MHILYLYMFSFCVDQCNSAFPVIQNMPNKSESFTIDRNSIQKSITIKFISNPFQCNGIITGYKLYTNLEGITGIKRDGIYSFSIYQYSNENFLKSTEVRYSISENTSSITGTFKPEIHVSKNYIIGLRFDKRKNIYPPPILFVHDQNYRTELDDEVNCALLNQSVSQNICQVKPLMELFFTPSK